VSARQQELINIMERVKKKEISQEEAEILFSVWKRNHEGGEQAKSFGEKLVRAFFSHICCRFSYYNKTVRC